MHENDDKNEKITLILREHRSDVNKEKLIAKSRYFASLFSHNFSDSNKSEHFVHYDFSFLTLKNFIEWIHDEQDSFEIHNYAVKNSLSKFLLNNFSELCNLLHVSIIYGAEGLTEDLTDIIIINWLSPDRLLHIWLMAQDFGLNILGDVCFSMCLDLFQELPLQSLVELSEKHFFLLVKNVNVNSSSAHLQFVQSEWAKHHRVTVIPSTARTGQPKFLDGMIVSKLNENTMNKMYIHIWDGFNFAPLTELKDMSDTRKEIIGMRVIGRGFNIYMVGGEMGLGTGRFNHIIWRYCLLSKKWYYHARLPVPRRHMVVVFIRNKLVIVGGVGRHRIKLDRVDLLDIHTGKWTDGEKMQDDFTEVPAHCVANGKLYILRVGLHIYDLESNLWSRILLPGTVLLTGSAIFANDTTLFLIGDESGETVLSRINATNDTTCNKKECLQTYQEHTICKNLPVYYENQLCRLRSMSYRDYTIVLLEASDFDRTNLHIHAMSRPDLRNYNINPKLGYFKVIDPQTLYDKA